MYNHISKVIESYRVNLFDIITQYRAVFPDDDLITSSSNSAGTGADAVLFYSWVNEKVCFVFFLPMYCHYLHIIIDGLVLKSGLTLTFL